MIAAESKNAEMRQKTVPKDSNVLRGQSVVKYIDFGIFWVMARDGMSVIFVMIYGKRFSVK